MIVDLEITKSQTKKFIVTGPANVECWITNTLKEISTKIDTFLESRLKREELGSYPHTLQLETPVKHFYSRGD